MICWPLEKKVLLMNLLHSMTGDINEYIYGAIMLLEVQSNLSADFQFMTQRNTCRCLATSPTLLLTHVLKMKSNKTPSYCSVRPLKRVFDLAFPYLTTVTPWPALLSIWLADLFNITQSSSCLRESCLHRSRNVASLKVQVSAAWKTNVC